MSRLIILAGLLINLAACSMTTTRDVEAPSPSANTVLLEELRQTLPGLYGNYGQYWTSRESVASATGVRHWRLSVVVLRSPASEAWFSLLQYPASDADQGNYLTFCVGQAAARSIGLSGQ